jgi:hypothetical protein
LKSRSYFITESIFQANKGGIQKKLFRLNKYIVPLNLFSRKWAEENKSMKQWCKLTKCSFDIHTPRENTLKRTRKRDTKDEKKQVGAALYSEIGLLRIDEIVWTVAMLLFHKEGNGKRGVTLKVPHAV